MMGHNITGQIERESGIDIIGKLPWGSHFCLFYKSREDLADVLVPYFYAGLKNNELCVCMASEPLGADALKDVMRQRIAGFDAYLEKGQIEIIPYAELYVNDEVLDLDRVINGWVEKLQVALDRGYSGLRASGNLYLLEKKAWGDSLEYEHKVNGIIGGHRMLALCTYSLDKCSAGEILEVASAHQFALIKHDREWKLIKNMEDEEVKKARLESEEMFRLFAETTPAMVFIYQDDRFVFINQAAEPITGYTREELFKMKPWQIIHPDHQEFIKERVFARQRGEQLPSMSEVKFLTKGGREKWVGLSAKTITYKNRPAGIVVAFDITRLKRAEKALRISETRYRIVADNTHDWEYWRDTKGRFVYVSPSCEKITGYAAKEFMEDDSLLNKVVFSDDLKALNKHRQYVEKRLLAGEIEFRIIRKDGAVRWISHVCQPVFDDNGAYSGIRASNRDITERKRAEEKMRESRRMLQLVIDNIPQGIFWKNINSVYLGCNAVFARSTGVGKPENIVGKTDYDLSYTKEQADSFRKYDRQVMDTDTPQYHIIERFLEAEGKLGWADTNKIPLHDDKGNVVGVLGTYEDITERKQTELELESAKSQAELYLDLMSHDINNMNQVGLGFLELALETLCLDEKGRSIISRSMEALASSSRLVDNVRKLQKVRCGELSNREIDVGQTLSDVCAYYSRVQYGNVAIDYEPVSGYKVMANELLYDVFSNIVDNAIKHSQGRPIINIRVRVEKIIDNGKRFYRVSIEDNGRGIPDELKGQIFDRFHRGGTKAKGKGLGLYLVKNLVESYNGRVWVEDRVPGDHTKGAKFVVLLPALL